MKKYRLLIILMLISALGFSQKLVSPIPQKMDNCGTQEATEEEMQKKFYYGDNDKFKQKYDSLVAIYGNISGNANYRNGTFGGEDNIWFRVPIKFWVYQWTATNDTLLNKEKTIKAMIWSINDAYRRNSIPVRFYAFCPEYIENQTAGSTTISDSDMHSLMSSNHHVAAINIHIPKDASSNFYYQGLSAPNAICIIRASTATNVVFPDLANGTRYTNSTFTHEVGHYFQLEHTHREGNGPCKELVTRDKIWSVCLNSFTYTRQCNRRADALCDTEADPNLDNYLSSIANCQWISGLQDQRGDTYRPNTKNYMAYGARTCRSEFSESQKTIILDWAANRNYAFSGAWSYYTNDFVDMYEPDDIDAMASPIKLNEMQEHAFGFFGCVADNSDWISYKKLNLNGDLLIEIEGIASFNNPVLDVEFWESNGTDISPKASILRTYASVANQGGKRTYRVACGSLVNANIYLFRIRRNGTQTGRYKVSLKQDNPAGSYGIPIIADPANNGCLNTTKRYYINLASLPAGNNPTIKWMAHSGLQILPSTPDNQTYVDVQLINNVAYGMLRVDTKSTNACFADGMGSSIVHSSLPSNYAVTIAPASVALCLGDVLQYRYLPPSILPANTGGLVSILWTVSSNLQITNETTTTPTITAITNGASTISVQITHFSSCSGYSYGRSTLTSWVGIPPTPHKSFGNDGSCGYAYVLPITGATDISINGDSFIPIVTPFSLPDGNYVISLSNSCGSTPPRPVTILDIPLCKTVGETPKEPIISVLPNPANIYLDVANILAGSEVKVYNKMGILVHSEKSENDYIRLDISKLNTDLYILEAVLPNGIKIRKQIIKE